MKIDLSCEIVRDLLPNYIDELASKSTVEVVEAHLQECKACNTIYKNMKEEEGKEGHSEGEDSEAEKMLFKKINRKMNKKTKVIGLIGLGAIIFVVALMQLLYNMALKEVPMEEVAISAQVYPIESLVTEENQKQSDKQLLITKGESKEDEVSYSITFPDMPNSNITVSKSLLAKESYLSYIAYESPYILRNIHEEIKTVDGQQVMYIEGIKTTLLNNKSENNGHVMSNIKFEKIDKIVYVDKKGTEEVLWENTMK